MHGIHGKTAAGRRAFLAGAAAAAALAGAPGARADTGPTLVGLSVVDRDRGVELPLWRRGGRAYVAGAPGARYGLRVTNRTGRRVLLVLSVDGVNVLTGATARYDQEGYVLDPYESYDVTGWRKSDAEVAAFTFAALSQSYAARTGRPGDVGVIGMAVFTERAPQPEPAGRYADAPPPPLPLPPVKAPAPSARAAPSASLAPAAEADAQPWEEKLGTGHGSREASYVARTVFVRAMPFPQSVRQIEYDTYAHLAARGIAPAPRPERRPRPFPLQPGPQGFVPDPPG